MLTGELFKIVAGIQMWLHVLEDIFCLFGTL